MLTSYLITWDCNPFLVSLAWCIKKSKQFNQIDIASDVTALALRLSVNDALKVASWENLASVKGFNGLGYLVLWSVQRFPVNGYNCWDLLAVLLNVNKALMVVLLSLIISALDTVSTRKLSSLRQPLEGGMATRCHSLVWGDGWGLVQWGHMSKVGVPVQLGPMHYGKWSHGNPPPNPEQTGTTENITFPQLRWRVVIIHSFVVSGKFQSRTQRN